MANLKRLIDLARENPSLAVDEIIFLDNCQEAEEKLADRRLDAAEVVEVFDTVLVINRSIPFDTLPLFSQDSSVWRGTKKGAGLDGEPEQDIRSLDLFVIDIAKIDFVSPMLNNYEVTTGEIRLMCLENSDKIRLDPQIGRTLYEERGQESLRWLYDNKRVAWMEFPGQTLRSSDGYRFLFCLCHCSDGSWKCSCSWLSNVRHVSRPAAVWSPPAQAN